MKDASYFTWILQTDSILLYLATSKGFVNTPGYLQKNPTFYDVKNHLHAIELILVAHYKESLLTQSDAQIRDTLAEYILNQTYNFREHQTLNCIERVSASATDVFVGNFLKSLYSKIKQVSQIPPNYSQEDSPLSPNQEINIRVMLSLKYSLKFKKQDLTQ